MESYQAADHLTPCERMRRALTGRKPDVLPAAPAYLSLFLAEQERAHYVEQYRRRLGDRSACPVDHEEDTLFRAEALYASYGVFQAQPDWLEIHQGASRAWAERTRIAREAGVLCYEDLVTGLRVPMLEVPMPRGDAVLAPPSASRQDLWDISGRLQGPTDVDALLPIVPAEDLLARGDYDLPRRIAGDRGGELYISTILDTPFSNAYDLLGFQGLMTIQVDRPELLQHLLQRLLEQDREVMSAWAACGIDGVYVEEVFSGADIISPRSYDRFVFAYNQPYFEHMRALGLLPIHYVCGDAVPRLERIVQYDIAAVGLEESKKTFTIEIADVVERVAGRVAVLGNIDAVRFGPGSSEEEMAAEVRRQAGIGARARGFVVSTGSPFPLDTNPRQIDALVATAHALPG